MSRLNFKLQSIQTTTPAETYHNSWADATPAKILSEIKVAIRKLNIEPQYLTLRSFSNMGPCALAGFTREDFFEIDFEDHDYVKIDNFNQK